MEIRSVSKAIRLMQALGDGATGVSELARQLRMDKASVSRILKTLEQGGFVAQDEKTRGYTLGLSLVHLGQKALRRIDLRTEAQTQLDLLADRIGECAQLAVFAQGKALIVAQARPLRGVNLDTPIGTFLPLNSTALGKVFLAFYDKPQRDEILARCDLDSFTRRTIRDRTILKRHIDIVRQRGAAFDDEEFSLGVRCIAAPVFDHNGNLVGALGISGPSPRISDNRISEYEEVVKREALRLSHRLGLEEASQNATLEDTVAS